MPIEIERKFLVTHENWRSQADTGRRMRQGYLNTEGEASVRVRAYAEHADLNIKAAVVGCARSEYEYPIPLDEAEEILDGLCGTRVVAKTRYRVPCGKHTWEVDVFEGRHAGLVVAEIELEDPDEAFERPDWAGQEVTSEKRYYNHYLAMESADQDG